MKSNRAVSAAMPSRGMRRGLFPFLSFGIAILFLTVANAHAVSCLEFPWTCGNTYVVNTTADSSDGSSACTSGNPCSLRDAITVANGDSLAGDTITFSVTGRITLTSALPAITRDLYIDGPGAGALTVSGNHAYQIFDFASANNEVSGLTLADGYNGSGHGGAILNSGTLTVTNCTFIGNSAPKPFYGGGGAIFGGTLTVTNSTFSGNSASHGGAILSTSPRGTLTVTDSTFSGNSAVAGGAIYSEGSATVATTVANSTFSGNSASAGGGAIYNSNSGEPDELLTVANSIFSGNLAPAGQGSGIYNESGIVTEGHNVFYENYATGTTTENDAAGLALNSDGTDKLNANPSLTPLASYGGPTETMMPEPGSAAICAGNATDLVTALGVSSLSSADDQRGFPASPAVGACANANIDIGAVQTNYLLVTNTSGSTDASEDCNATGTGTACSLPDAIALADGQDYTDIGFSPSLGGGSPTITADVDGLFLSQGDTVIVGPPDAVTLSAIETSPSPLLAAGPSATVTVYGLTVAELSGVNGGNFVNSGTLTVVGSTFYGPPVFNNPQNVDNSITNYSGTLTVTDSTFYDTSSGPGVVPEGGAIKNGGGTATVTNSTFSGNSAQGGGAIYSGSGTLTVVDSVFDGNSAANGGAIYLAGGAINESNNLFYGNYVTGSPTTESDAYGFTLSSTDVTGAGADPKLAPLGNYGGSTQTMLLLPGSAAICSGTPTLPFGLMLPGTDQRGFSRTTTYTINSAQTTCVDIGAVQTNYQSIQFTNIPANGYTDVVGMVVNPPAPNVSVTENGQNIGGVPVTLALGNFTGASPYTTGGLGPVTTVAGSGATFSGLTVSTTGTGTLSATLNLFTPKDGTPVSITTNPAATLTVEMPEQAAIDYVNLLYTDEVLSSGQDNSLVKEMDKATELISEGKISGAINNLQDFISEVNDLYSSGVLNQTQANTLLGYANYAINLLE